VCANRWALNNPHISVHIPTSSRLTVSTQVKANGQPRRPSKSLASLVSNLHLLLRVPSFARWPLRVHFFNREVFAAWDKWCAKATEQLRTSLAVVTDFGRGASPSEGGTDAAPSDRVGGGLHTWGIHALPLDYEPIREYVAKGQDIFEFERQGRCVVCRAEMQPGEGLLAVCTNDGCDGVGHLSCWSRHFLEGDEAGSIVPVQGQCPKCDGEVHWGDMMRELTLRERGQKEVDKLLKRKGSRGAKKASGKA
jgi:structure-specific endonuclease subunit SLX1